MPAIEIRRSPNPAASENFSGSAAEGFSGRESGHDFDTVMQSTLAPNYQKSTVESQSASSAKKSGEISSEKTNRDKRDTTTQDAKASPDANQAALNVAVTDPLPAYLSLPIYLSGAFSETAGTLPTAESSKGTASKGKSGGVEKISTSAQDLAGKTEIPTASAQKEASPKTLLAETTPSKTPAHQPDINLTSKVLSQVTSSEAAAFEKIAPGADKSKSSSDAPATSAGDLAASETSAQPDPASLSHDNPQTSPSLAFTPAISLEKMAENAGTGVANTPTTMKNSQKTNKVAGPDVKVLPLGESGASRAKNLPSPAVVSPVRTAENRSSDLNFSFANGSNQAPATETTQSLNVLDLPSLADARLRAVERTHDMMALHSMRLVDSKADSLTVVIKPAPGTELSLELRQHADGVEMRATLTRGDHQFLSQNWPDLQQRLEQRGIKLASLGGDTSFSTNDNSHYRQQQTSQDDAAQQASAFAEFAATSPGGGATARLAMVHDGWESWA
jgi:hypothetical protein